MLRAMIYSDDKIHKISMQSFYAEDLYNLDNRIPRKLIYRITDKIFKNQCVDDWKKSTCWLPHSHRKSAWIIQFGILSKLFPIENATDFYSLLEHNLSLKLHEFRNVWSILGLNANFIRGTNNTAYLWKSWWFIILVHVILYVFSLNM